MGDPTGIGGAVAGIVLQELLTVMKKTINCKEECQTLLEHLENIQPMVSDAFAHLKGDSSTHANGNVVPGSGSPVRKFLDDLGNVLAKAKEVVMECQKVNPRNYFKLYPISRKILKFTKQIDEICNMQASLAVLNVGVRTNRAVDRIEQTLNGRDVRAEIFDNLRQLPDKTFGLDAQLANLQNLLIGEAEKKWVVLCGKGGIGKTLLAEKAFNSQDVRDYFQENVFWLTVGRKTPIGPLLQNLARQMHLRTKNMQPDEVKTKLFNVLHGKKVLLFLDDVWDEGPPVLDKLDVISRGTGSKILVTTRHEKVLRGHRAQGECVVRMDRLSEDDSWKLFCEHAFRGEKIPGHLDETVVKAVTDECKGLPLALKVTGGALAHEESPEMWQRQLKKLKEAQPLDQGHEVELYGNLQLSYDSLASVDPRLQKCFIYFAAFPEDYEVDSEKLVNLWAGEKLLEASDDTDDDFDPSVECFYLLSELIERSLIDLRELHWSARVNSLQLHCRLHDVLRDFARYLINQKRAPMDCLFSASSGLAEFPHNWSRDPDFTSNTTHLSLNHNPLESLPINLKAPRLEVLLLANTPIFNAPMLQYSRSGLVISHGFLESFLNLKVLDLHGSRIVSLPETLGNLTNLRYLELSYTGLRKLPQGLRKLTKLENLGLRGCSNLEPWPFDISSCLMNLSTLHSEGCLNIWSPVPADKLTGRRTLESLCHRRKLRNLSISSSLHQHLPSQMSHLGNLRQLSISFTGLEILPPEFQHLSKLQYLSLRDCLSLSELPSWMESLSQLANLSLQRCTKLTTLPNLHKLQKLWKLDLSHCESLHQLPVGFTKSGAFPNLKELNMSCCKGLREFPPIKEGAFGQLNILKLDGCESLQKLPPEFTSKGAFPTLKELNMYSCTELYEIPPIEDGAFPMLMMLDMSYCRSLQELPTEFASMGAFPALRELNLSGCSGLQKFPPIRDGAFPQLEILSLSFCKSLKKLPAGFASKGGFPALKELNIYSCTRLDEIPPIREGAFPQLVLLDMSYCGSLQQLPTGFTSRGAFPALKELNMHFCSRLPELPPIEEGALPRLMVLDLTGCGFEDLPNSLRLLPKLAKLDLSRCTRLKNLDNCFCLHGRDSRDVTSQVQHRGPYFENLQELGLNDVHLENLPPDLNETCPALKTIHLRPEFYSFLTKPNIPENLQILQAEGKLNIVTVELSF